MVKRTSLQRENIRNQTNGSANDRGQSRSSVNAELIDQLQKQIRKFETASRPLDTPRISSGCRALDQLLPGNGYQRGMLVQFLTGGGQAADHLSLLVAKEASHDGGAIVIVDPLNQFYPPAAAALGINLDNLIILRGEESESGSPNFSGPGGRSSSTFTNTHTQSPSSASSDLSSAHDISLLWSIDQALRCPAVAAVWGPLPSGELDERWFRRFQLSAEASGCVGLFVQPLRAARQPSWAEVQWLVGAARARPATRIEAAADQRVRLQLTRCRGGQSGQAIELSIDSVTGNVQPARRDHETQHHSHRLASPHTELNRQVKP